ncbi:steroid 5-alpha-reductase DET2-like [Nicotiana tabacum]|uniref:Steroid 5-alpha-reductase DET2 n=1 Tax=Nicotiana tabacum TaxID=4097 RepID=A0A1S4CLT1_TOBAC|nr:steroid 5-alpha-reductase DET2 [Nicotiana tomentosiformis]XP_016501894.1 PREDICTED: steroid 5-alpha-reductase DET2-like [Nicotiana tabacum]
MFTDQNIYHYSLLSLFVIAPPTFLALQFLTAPYGKHHRSGWGPTISPPLAWFLMESPTLWLTLLLFPFGQNHNNPLSFILISPYLFHYINRTIIYPIKLAGKSRIARREIKNPPPESGFPVSIAMMAFAFNLLNAYVQARWVSHYADFNADEWFWLRFAGGIVVFTAGMTLNVWADKVLVGLKGEGGGYKIPKGGLFEYVSCPNYLGEIVEWLGWALMTWSWAGFGFFLYTFANLVPRACANHEWYLQKFGEDYPRKRKAVIPFLY